MLPVMLPIIVGVRAGVMLDVLCGCAAVEGDCEFHLQSETEKYLSGKLHIQRCPAVLPAKGKLSCVKDKLL